MSIALHPSAVKLVLETHVGGESLDRLLSVVKFDGVYVDNIFC